MLSQFRGESKVLRGRTGAGACRRCLRDPRPAPLSDPAFPSRCLQRSRLPSPPAPLSNYAFRPSFPLPSAVPLRARLPQRSCPLPARLPARSLQRSRLPSPLLPFLRRFPLHSPTFRPSLPAPLSVPGFPLVPFPLSLMPVFSRPF